MITLNNGQWSAVISEKGAELQSYKNNESGRELIWQGDSKYWGRRAPILFPVIGGLKEDRYVLKGKEYKMGKHGFCRDALFEVVSQSESEACFQLSDTPETLKAYPYSFIFEVIFQLKEDKLVCRFNVENKNEETMWFCLGGHPAFNLPMNDKLKFEDYRIRFEKEETAPLWYLKDDLLAGKKENWLNESDRFNLKTELFDNDALIFHRLRSKKIFIETEKDDSSIEFDLGSFPMAGIWTKEGGAPFLCVEPWYGVDDSIDSDGDFTKKWEAVSLNTGKQFGAWFSIAPC